MCSLESGPGRSRFGFRSPSVEHIIHDIENAPGPAVSGHQLHDELVRKSPCMAPGANPHADVTIRSDLSPVIKTGLLIQFPPESAIHHRLFAHGNGLGRAAGRAFFANPTKILDPNVGRFVRD